MNAKKCDIFDSGGGGKPKIELTEHTKGLCHFREHVDGIDRLCQKKATNTHLCKTHKDQLKSKKSAYCRFEMCLLKREMIEVTPEKVVKSKYCLMHLMCRELKCHKHVNRGEFCRAHYEENRRNPNTLELKLTAEQLKQIYTLEEMIAEDPILQEINIQHLESNGDRQMEPVRFNNRRLFGAAFQESFAMLPSSSRGENTHKKQKT